MSRPTILSPVEDRTRSRLVEETSVEPKLLFVVTEDWYFWSHRLPIARAARDNGFKVLVATRVNKYASHILDEGFTLLPVKMMRESINPLRELETVLELIRLFRRERPDIIHLVALKPIVYGSVAAHIARTRAAVVGAIAGIGFLGTSSSVKARVLRLVTAATLRLMFDRNRHKLLVQNQDDLHLLRGRILKNPERAALIKGAGVDTRRYCPSEERPGTPVVVLASRMLSNKGVAEFVGAARILKERRVRARFLLVGDTDPASPAALSREQLQRWHEEGAVEWTGYEQDMPSVFRNCHVVCLPSYREGLPKVLLEAMSSARAIVTTDVPGCREVVSNGDNGILVPPRDANALASALELLIQNADLRNEMGKRGRLKALREFSSELIGEQTMSVYLELLNCTF